MGQSASRRRRQPASPAILAAILAIPASASAQSQPSALVAGVGVTAVSGRVVGPDGAGLAQVRVTDNSVSSYTDGEGRFLLAPVPVGKSVVQIDARTVGAGQGTDYGFYEVQAIASVGKTTPLDFTSWLTPIDHAHDVTIAAPTTKETVITNPSLPGLELHIAPGTIIRDAQGKLVTKVSLTSVAPAHQPFPGPPDHDQKIAFTIQPGAACLYTANGGIGYAQIVYPNYHHQLPRARESFMRYEPDARGWSVYGAGTVNRDASQVVPDKNAVLTDFDSAECDERTRSHPLVIPNYAIRGMTP